MFVLRDHWGDTIVITLDAGLVELTVDQRGHGRPVLLLHGGGGPATVAGFADLLSRVRPAQVITPTHPGFGGTPRPDGLAGIADLAALYVRLLDELDVVDVCVVGNSIGGWIAAEMALLHSSRITGVLLVDAVGIDVPGHPVVDFFSLTLDEVAQLSYHDPGKAVRIDLAALSPAERAAMAANRAALATYGGATMTDPGLAGRLAAVTVPTLVLWGESDQIVDPDYGRAYAAAIPGARFRLLTGTGHVPQVETPDDLIGPLWDFVDAPRPGP